MPATNLETKNSHELSRQLKSKSATKLCFLGTKLQTLSVSKGERDQLVLETLQRINLMILFNYGSRWVGRNLSCRLPRAVIGLMDFFEGC